MVRLMVAWVTAGLVAPGVRRALGRMAPKRLTTDPPVDAATATTGCTGAAGLAAAGAVVAATEEGVVTGTARTCAVVSAALGETFWLCVAGPQPVTAAARSSTEAPT